jgi:hypothetical protein
MKTLVATAVFLLFGLSQANAAPNLNISGQGIGAALAAEADFLNSAHAGLLTVTLDNNSFFSAGIQSAALQSSVGVGEFSATEAGAGIDNITVANVTEPGTVALLVLGLFGVALAFKRKDRG